MCCSGVLSKALLPGRRIVTKPLNDRERFDCSQTSLFRWSSRNRRKIRDRLVGVFGRDRGFG